MSGEEERYPEGEDGSWYLGKAKEEFHRRQGKGGSTRDEEDPIQACFFELSNCKITDVISVGTGSTRCRTGTGK